MMKNKTKLRERLTRGHKAWQPGVESSLEWTQLRQSAAFNMGTGLCPGEASVHVHRQGMSPGPLRAGQRLYTAAAHPQGRQFRSGLFHSPACTKVLRFLKAPAVSDP